MFMRGLLLTSLLVPLSAVNGGSQTPVDSNVSAKLTGNLVPHAQVGRGALRQAPITPCTSDGTSLVTSGTPGVLYDLFVQLQDVTVGNPPDAINFRIDYEPTSGGQGLEIIAWESFAGTEIRHPNVNGEDWPAPGSGVSLVIGDESPAKRASLDAQDRGTRPLGRFLVLATGSATFRFTTNSPPVAGDVGSSRSNVMIHDGSGYQSLAAPDNVGEVAFGSAATGYDPCAASASPIATDASTVELKGLKPLAVASQANPSTSIQWVVSSSKERLAKASLYTVSGRLIKRWDSVVLSQGTTRLAWDGLDETGTTASAGVYYLEVTSEDGYRVVTKAVLVRP